PACRALSQPEAAQGPPAPPAADVVASFLGAMVDHLVRTNGSAPVARGRHSQAVRPARFDSLHDQWIHTLLADQDQLQGKLEELEQLAEQVARWRRPIAVAAAAPLRLCFRLEEPPVSDAAGAEERPAQPARRGHNGAADEWTVRYLDQAADDPSLIVP